MQYPVYPYALRLKRLRVGLGRETSEVFEGPEGLEAKGVCKVSEQYRPLRTWGSKEQKRAPGGVEEAHHKEARGVIFYLGP